MLKTYLVGAAAILFVACGQDRQEGTAGAEDRLRAQGIAVVETFMRAALSGDSMSLAATTTAALAAELRGPGRADRRPFLRDALATFQPGDLVRGGDDLLLEFTYRDAEGQQRAYFRLRDEAGLKVAGILDTQH